MPSRTRLLSAHLLLSLALTAPFLTAIAKPSHAGIVATYILSGVPAPDGNGQFLTLRAPILNNAGELSFSATLTNTAGGSTSADRQGVFRQEADGTITQIARGLQTTPGGGGVFAGSFGETTYFNDDGDVAFGPSGNISGIYRGLPLVKIVRTNDALPEGNGVVNSVTTGGINNAGQVSYVAALGAPAPTNSNQAVYRSDGVTTVKIARTGDTAPGGTNTYSSFGTQTHLNEAGEVVFSATAGSFSGAYRGDGTTTTLLARAVQPAPGPDGAPDGVYGTITAPTSINDNGEAVFVAKLGGSSTGSGLGLFRSDGVNAARIFHSGQPAPNAAGRTAGTFSGWDRAMINNQGQVITWATLQGTPGGSTDNQGLFISDGTTVRQIMRNGDPSPDGNGRLQFLSRNSIINDAGQTAFFSNHTAAIPGTLGGIYFFDPEDGLITVARDGQPFLGSTITSLSLAGHFLDTPINSMETSGLNESGQVAFRFRLATGAEGFAIWSPPNSDFNDDGHIDGQDLARWTSGFGDAPAAQFDGDADGDQDADGADFLTWQRNLGAISATAVPEPSTAVAILAITALRPLRQLRKRP